MEIFKSTEPDEIHQGVLKAVAQVVSELLVILLDNSWRTGEVSEDRRKAN